MKSIKPNQTSYFLALALKLRTFYLEIFIMITIVFCIRQTVLAVEKALFSSLTLDFIHPYGAITAWRRYNGLSACMSKRLADHFRRDSALSMDGAVFNQAVIANCSPFSLIPHFHESFFSLQLSAVGEPYSLLGKNWEWDI